MQTQQHLLKFTSKIIIVLALLITSVTACKKDDDEVNYREFRAAAWNHLSANQKASVIVDWQTAPVERYTYKAQAGTEVPAVTVTFATKDDAILGPIQVFVNIKTKIVIGVGGRF